MLYIFRGGNQIVKFEVENKLMRVASQRTGNKLVPLTLLFKKNKIDELNLKVNNMTIEEFDKYILSEFTRMGYYLVSKDG
jgi:hypothetical protein